MPIKSPFDDEISLLLEKAYGKVVKYGGLQEFIVKVSPKLSIVPHLQPLIDVLEANAGKNARVLVSLPPRHGKTTTISHAFPYSLSLDPTKLHAYVTYSGELAKSKSRQIRRLALDAGIQLDRGSKSLSEWRTKQGGGLIATSIGGALTGQGVTGMLVVDDPFKGREDADSPAQRDKVWEWFTDVAYTRLEPGSSCVIVQTRWNEEDLIGKLEKYYPNEWTTINLPAIDDFGKALWPSCYPVEKLEELRGILGDYSFESLYQGRPRPKGANIFKEPRRYTYPQSESEFKALLDGKYLIIAVDPAATAKTSADYSVVMLMAKEDLGVLGRAWVLDVVRKQVTIPVLVDLLKEYWEKYKCSIAVEAVGGFKAVPQMLEHVDPRLKIGKNIMEVRATADKFTRAQPVSAAWNAGRVLVPSDAPWSDLFLDEVMSFTGLGQRHDDQVDALSHAWNAFANMKHKKKRGFRLSDGPFG